MADAGLVGIRSNARNGDGLPSNLTADFSDIQYSNLLYPVGTQPTDYWYMVATYPDADVSGNIGTFSTRTKIINLNFGNVFLHNFGEGTLFYIGVPGTGPSTYCINTTLNYNIKNLHVANHNADPDQQRIRGLGSALILSGSGTTGVISHTRWNFNIDNYEGNDKILGAFNLSNNASATDNQVNINIKEAVRTTAPEEPTVGGQNAMFYLYGGFQNIPAPLIKINVGHARDHFGNVFDVAQSYNNYVLSGIYSTYVASQATLQFLDNTTNYRNVFLKDITLIRPYNDDAIAPNYPITVFVLGSNVTLSHGLSPNVSIVGSNINSIYTIPDLQVLNQ